VSSVKLWLTCVAVVAAIAGGLWWLGGRIGQGSGVRDRGPALRRAEPRPLAPDPQLQPPAIYPYSVVPGGVRSRPELWLAMATDPVVQRVYAEFAVNRCKLVRLQRDRWVYVSYRYGSEIFWTRHRVRLRKGEQVITDGRHMARARCGNSISEVPRAPVWNAEPPPSELERPALPEAAGLRGQGSGVSPAVPELGFSVPNAQALTPTAVAIPAGAALIPVALPAPGPPRPLTPSPVPESGTLILTAIGLVIIGPCWRKIFCLRGLLIRA
jgi:hypothetical protein